MSGLPSVSVVIPVLNERDYIRDCLDAMLRQDYPNILEMLVIDGGSTDGTRDLVTSARPPIRLVDNPKVTAAAALNIGIREAKGDVICRVDGHALAAPDYVRRCVEVLEETGAANVGGRVRPVATTPFGRAVVALMGSRLGFGPGGHHNADSRESVDTVFPGCWWRTTLESLGGLDEDQLQWAAEDHELNFRLRQRGGDIILDPQITMWYFPRSTPRGLLRQYANYGNGKASTLAKHRSLPNWRPLGPAGLVAASVVGFLLGRGVWRVAVPGAHAGVSFALAVSMARQPGVWLHHAWGAILLGHWAYGVGFWRGVGRVLSRRSFDTRPTGHR